ncbi:hypothetical protein ACFQ0B_13080 [Nonomuraea thailandensis]
MLFERRLREGVQDGSITLAFRRWKRAQVTAGGRYRMGSGLMAEVTSVAVTSAADVTEGTPGRRAMTTAPPSWRTSPRAAATRSTASACAW